MNQTSNRRKWWMRIAAILLGLSPLILLECGLRVFSSAVPDAVDLDPLVNLESLQPIFVHDPSSQQWVVPESRSNFFQPASFAFHKPPQSKRIFVLGGSTTQGRPFAHETAFSTWLKLRLEAADPMTEFEVVNVGGVSYASYRVAKILDECLTHQPDLIVLYTGHNEFLEDRTYAAVRELSTTRKWVSRVAGKLHTVRWVKGKLAAAPATPTRMSAEVNARLDHPGGLDAFRRDPVWKQGVIEHFERTMREMVAACVTADVPLILCAPASDLVHTPPLKVEMRDDLDASQSARFEESWSRACDFESSAAARLQACDECLRIDSQHAGAHFIAGRLRFESGDSNLALVHLNAARDHDVCPLRATTAMVDRVRQLALDQQIPLVDVPVLFDRGNHLGQKVPDGIADPSWFVDHVHPSIAGHQKIAEAIAGLLDSTGWLAIHPNSQQAYLDRVSRWMADLPEPYHARGKQRLEGLRKWASGRAGDMGIDSIK